MSRTFDDLTVAEFETLIVDASRARDETRERRGLRG